MAFLQKIFSGLTCLGYILFYTFSYHIPPCSSEFLQSYYHNWLVTCLILPIASSPSEGRDQGYLFTLAAPASSTEPGTNEALKRSLLDEEINKSCLQVSSSLYLQFTLVGYWTQKGVIRDLFESQKKERTTSSCQ